MKESSTYKFVAISGSLRKGSYNTMALKVAQKIAPANIDIEHLGITDIPFFNADIHDIQFPEPVNLLAQKIKDADGLLLVSPEYNYSIPGVLKNTIDIVSRHPLKPFDNKAVAVMGVSPGLLGTVRMQYHVRQVMVFVNAWVVNKPEVMISQAKTKFDENGNLTDARTADFIKQLIIALADLSDRLKQG
jgi:chromate reductase, NAD(P)H dehydrogenase (quinone)